MRRVDKLLLTLVAVLVMSVLLTGGLAVYLTLARGGGEAGEAAPMEPSLSPAAMPEPRIAFVSDQEGEAAIFVMEADGSDQHRVSGEDQGLCLFPSWSPDGSRVAYLELSEQGRGGVWVTRLDGTMPFSVSPPIAGAPLREIDAVPPAWSLDGTQLAYVTLGQSSRTALEIARADGGGIEYSVPLTGHVAEDLRRSPVDERYLIVGPPEVGESDVYTLSTESEGPSLIMTGTTAADWSPDGRRIAVAEQASRSVLVVQMGGEVRLLAQFSTTPIDVRWSPDGRLMAVVAAGSVRQGYGDALHVVDVADGAITSLVDGEAWAGWPEWSSDGKRLLFTRGPLIRRSGLPYGDLWVYDVVSGDLDQLTAQQGFAGLGAWSP
ncbi:MAG: hypothetical protein PVH41_03300 [Anaerolineae bacterium]|jgi:Tol biopolymer transport system component